MTPRERPADMLARLMRLFRLSGTEMAERSAAMGPLFALNRNFISNLRRTDSIPTLHHLYAISELLRLRLGSVFEIFGIDLDAYLDLIDNLHQDRTRLVETCPFGSNRMVYVPAILGPEIESRTTAPLWQLVAEWNQVSMLTIRDAIWRDHRFRYGRLGVSDTNAAPDIPAGAYVQVRIFEPTEIHRLNRDTFYFIQYPLGYIACRCEFQKGWLYLHPNNPSFNGPKRLRYGSEALILGTITAFAAELPTVGYRKCPPRRGTKRMVSALPPWEHPSLQSLFRMERLRLRVKAGETATVNAKLHEVLGISVNAQYSKKFERSEHVSQTAKALALTAAYAIRISDMFRCSGIPLNNPDKYDIEQLLSVDRVTDLPAWPTQAPAPQPPELWRNVFELWHEWPLLLSRVAPAPQSSPYEIVRFHQEEDFPGLDPLIHPGSILRIDGAQRHIPTSPHDVHAHERDWARRLYVLRVTGRQRSPLLCGYVHATQTDYRLISHPNAKKAAIHIFPRSAVEVIGTVTGIASAF
jgi:transcriptional regulator with XRE-family HTH domain